MSEHHVEMIHEGQMNIFEAAYQQEKQEEIKMLSQAIEKLKGEMAKNNLDAYTQATGQILIDLVNQQPDLAKNIMTDKKTIAGSIEVVKKDAKKSAKSNVGIVAPDRAAKLILEYFGIEDIAPTTIYAYGHAYGPSNGINDAPQRENCASDLNTAAPKECKKQLSQSQVKNAPSKKFEASLDEFL